jgi:hypothetical protein
VRFRGDGSTSTSTSRCSSRTRASDARTLYLWSAPAPVPGWSDVRATPGVVPGSIVRIRDGRDDEA